MYIFKAPLLASIGFTLVMNITVAAPVKWQALTAIQQDVLRDHASHWNHYSESRQRKLIKQHETEIIRKNAWKKWFNEKLTPQDRKAFISNKKMMSKVQFKHYVDTLFSKYGKPR